MSQNYYHVLGVSALATDREIKAAYKQLAIQYHPDKHGGSTKFEEQFKAVNAAYRVLSDPARRAAYDHQLRQEVLRAEAILRQQQFRSQSQRVYGVPMPPPAPLRTRRPSTSSERHYRPIPKRQAKFTRRDYQLTAAVVGMLILFLVSVKVTMDHFAAVSNYNDGLRAYTERRWSTADSYLSEALRFKPDYAAALQRRAEIRQLVYRDYKGAHSDYYAALREAHSAGEVAPLLFRMGQCEASLNRPDSAELNLTRALALDSTMSGAWLTRGEVRLFDKRRFEAAVQDFSTGLRQRAELGRPIDYKYLTYRGLASFKIQNFGAAREDYRQVLIANPGNGQVHFLLGRLAQQEGNEEAACEFFRRAVALGYAYADEARRQNCP
ncbi:J domain-containing protein [Hymenobacter jejuensis]|uniref:J domain-containing protein n=1 Tax=Hymenobacter jejuensis TaxID=2502781 RepID=UPI001E48355B|nr:J domain-containing protein [Hymenobacter jejuensis]